MEFQPMSPEEMQRTMQFLLAQQAQFATDLEKLTAKTDRMADAMIGLTGIVGRIADQVVRIADQQERTDRQLRETNTHVEKIGDHLDVVIEMFERHLREDHGQRPS